MYKLAVIGDKDSIISFKILGLDVFSVNLNSSIEDITVDVRKKVDYLANNKYGIIFMTEECAEKSAEVIERYKRETTPMIIMIPSNRGTLNVGMNEIDKNIEKAIGTNIF